jgi:hypothetical protein
MKTGQRTVLAIAIFMAPFVAFAIYQNGWWKFAAFIAFLLALAAWVVTAEWLSRKISNRLSRMKSASPKALRGGGK